ncbi:MAG: AAA family ATPase [Candidatus Aenigmatarchaeota archaeon]|nr:MAG: AAA family ATPase [Candidatus Aenigmarchaeota archaeon]
MATNERVSIGVPGLDEMLNGGVPRGHTVLLAGTAGTGKTIFCTHFIYTGATKYKEPGVFLSFEESPESIKSNALNFGMDFGKLENNKMTKFLRYDPYNIEDMNTNLESIIREINAQRVVIDSVSAMEFYVRENTNFRKLLMGMSNSIKKLGCTTILTSEIMAGTHGISRGGVEEFIADSAIVLYYNRIGSAFSRAVQVWKMRGTSHSEKLHPYKITDKGVVVFPEEEAFIDEKRSSYRH